MSVPSTRTLAAVLRTTFSTEDDAVRLVAGKTVDGVVTPAGYAPVEIGGHTYTVPAASVLSQLKRGNGTTIGGNLVWLLVTREQVLALDIPSPT